MGITVALSMIKVDRVKVELKYLNKVFDATCQKFLTAIDRMDFHPSQNDDLDTPQDPDNHHETHDKRTKRSACMFGQQMWRAEGILKQLDEEDIECISKILDNISEH